VDKVKKQEWLKELQKPITVQADQIMLDLFKFVKEFPINEIPHVTEEELEIRAIDKAQGSKMLPGISPKKGNMYQHYDRQNLTYNHIKQTLSEVRSSFIYARLILKR